MLQETMPGSGHLLVQRFEWSHYCAKSSAILKYNRNNLYINMEMDT